MTTKNFRRMNCCKANNPQTFPHSISFKCTDNTTQTVGQNSTTVGLPISSIDSTSNNNTCMNSGSSSLQCVNIVAGSGNTAPTEDDYKLETPLSLTYSSSAIIPIYDENNEPIGTNYVKNWINNTGAEVTIREIGAICYMSSYSKSILIERTVLETPVTVASGDTVGISFKMFY